MIFKITAWFTEDKVLVELYAPTRVAADDRAQWLKDAGAINVEIRVLD